MNNSINILVITTSLNPKSKSRVVAQKALLHLQSKQVDIDWIDLQDHKLPFCDGQSSSKTPVVKTLISQIEKADGILLTAPVYNFDLNAASKNLLELTGNAWMNKVVGIAVSAGGMRSGMSPLGMMNSLMLDFHCIMIPRYVYVSPNDFTPDNELEESSLARLYDLNTELIRISSALKA
jgi:NAD(P)H-dependent FMN reductase